MSVARTTLRQRVQAHLSSAAVARIIYGTIIGLALVLTLERHPPPAATAAVALAATAVAVGLAELYSEVVGTEARTRRPVARADLRALVSEALAVAFGGAFPATYFLLAAVGVLGLDTAFALAKWTGLGLICGYGFLAARLAGSGIGRSLVHAAAVGLVGGLLIALKAVLH